MIKIFSKKSYNINILRSNFNILNRNIKLLSELSYKLNATTIDHKQIQNDNLRKNIVHISEITKPKYYGILFYLKLEIFIFLLIYFLIRI